ncbi:MAG: amidophosphoribosyltransferase [Cyclobacteriaceae bacterium]
MSDPIKHECGIALIRLRKPLSYYIDKYGYPGYGMSKLYILMEKQHNRGQDGAGVANIKLNIEPGYKFFSRLRSAESTAIKDIFEKIGKKYRKAKKEGGNDFYNADWLKKNCEFTGEMWLGHLRYGTHGKNNVDMCHPMSRQNNWRSRNLVIAGNFNMTNVDELFNMLIDIGQNPREKTDTVTVMEKIGHFLDEENQAIFDEYKDKLANREITEIIENQLNLQKVLQRACKDFDGGYTMAGVIGHGASFVARDPAGIRPAYWYADDEVVVVASEKPAIKTAFDVEYSQIKEIKPAHALIIDKEGNYAEKPFIDPIEKKSCSFERIYFSRPSDPDIYQERRNLGNYLLPQVLKSCNSDLKNTVFSYIPNSAETAFLGMMSGLEEYLVSKRKEVILEGKPSMTSMEELLSFRPRVEKLVIKDAKLRTFITDDDHRDEMVSNVYDTTYEVINKKQDTVVVIDDSIVRGTTLEKSILRTLNRLEPKKIVIVSSAPQIRFPDCYGIDMSRMKEFVAFRAALELLKETDQEHIMEEVFEKCLSAKDNRKAPNYVKEIYRPFPYEEISRKIAEIVRPPEMKCDLEIVYQTVENLHKACPNHLGDWYFTGDYPTAGGNKVANTAFVNFMQGVSVRAY